MRTFAILVAVSMVIAATAITCYTKNGVDDGSRPSSITICKSNVNFCSKQVFNVANGAPHGVVYWDCDNNYNCNGNGVRYLNTSRIYCCNGNLCNSSGRIGFFAMVTVLIAKFFF